ncbi:MurR/RpiR family transcriptional regulator [Thaumasiovibrio sp. DFM-14]|uniref:MurR/RpiR family transcriptional regulator n=1 Tax=Thaumasiovibrio sp. DFM-14 TaxID=3384792 RepID=UPI0039A0624C
MQLEEPSVLNTPADLDSLRELTVKRYDSLSQRLQQVADFIMAQPMVVAVETMATIAEQADVPLSTLSRFANAMGFSGFSQMQSLFREQYLNRPRDYKERVRHAKERDGQVTDSPASIFQDFGNANVEAIEQLQLSVSPQKLERAVTLMDNAETLYIQGVRRAYPVAFYLWYALMKSDKNVVLLDDHGGMLAPMVKKMNERDVLLAVTYTPYAQETSELIELAYERNVPIISITDNQMSAQGSKISICFEVQEGELMGFRSLSSSMFLAQSLAVALTCKEID